MPRKTTLQTFGLFLALAAIVSCAPLLWTLSLPKAGHDPNVGLSVGEPLPGLEGADGWINGELTNGDLRGKVVVIDYWFLTCRICHQAMPEFVALRQKYAHRDDVVFLGLTHNSPTDPQEPHSVENIQRFVEQYHITWPNAYGAVPMLTAMRAYSAPLYWVVGRDGRVVWNRSSATTIDAAIETAIGQSAPANVAVANVVGQ